MSVLNEIFYRPIFNLLIFLYNTIPYGGIGIAIILLTVIIKLVLWPLSMKVLKSQRALADLQPQVEELKKIHGENKEAMAQALMALYSREKVSPASSCLPVLVQLPVLISLYHALSKGISSSGFEALYPFVANPGKIDGTFFGILDLQASSAILAVLAGVVQFIQTRMMVVKPQPHVKGSGDEEMLATMNRQMMYIMPIVTVLIAWNLPGGISLYWLANGLMSVIQQVIFFRYHHKPAAVTANPNAPIEVEVIPPKK